MNYEIPGVSFKNDYEPDSWSNLNNYQILMVTSITIVNIVKLLTSILSTENFCLSFFTVSIISNKSKTYKKINKYIVHFYNDANLYDFSMTLHFYRYVGTI